MQENYSSGNMDIFIALEMVKLGGLLFILFFNACAETKTTCLISCKDS